MNLTGFDRNLNLKCFCEMQVRFSTAKQLRRTGFHFSKGPYKLYTATDYTLLITTPRPGAFVKPYFFTTQIDDPVPPRHTCSSIAKGKTLCPLRASRKESIIVSTVEKRRPITGRHLNNCSFTRGQSQLRAPLG